MAYDRILERKVTALEVERSRLKHGLLARGRYFCPNPECRARVKFYPDGERITHFKHYARAANPDCHLFWSTSPTASLSRAIPFRQAMLVPRLS